MAVIAHLSVTGHTSKEPDEILDFIYELEETMHKGAEDIPDMVEERKTFIEELEILINRHSVENGSNTPDFILAKFLFDSLHAFEDSVNAREKWYGRPPAGISNEGANGKKSFKEFFYEKFQASHNQFYKNNEDLKKHFETGGVKVPVPDIFKLVDEWLLDF